MRHALLGLIAVALLLGAVALTGFFLTGGLTGDVVTSAAEFGNCGQGLRVGGDVKLRGVLVGRIGGIDRVVGDVCRVEMDLNASTVDEVPKNVGAQIRAKTIFGEKWVELLYPDDPDPEPIAQGTTIPTDRTIDPLEVETILNVALPILEAIDPEHLAGALTALAEGFVGHEDAAIRGIERGIVALRSANRTEPLLKEGIRQLAESGEVFENVDDDLLAALDALDEFNRFTAQESELIATNLRKAPTLLRELSTLFEVRFDDLVRMVNSGATVIDVLAARSGDVDRLLDQLWRFNSNWIRNINHVCRYRQATDEPGKSVGDPVPGRCWRVHNIISPSRGPYEPGEAPRPGGANDADGRRAGFEQTTDVARVLYKPTLDGGRR